MWVEAGETVAPAISDSFQLHGIHFALYNQGPLTNPVRWNLACFVFPLDLLG
jgi:hypothetical protein